jgi:hypothetical protein
MEGFRLHFSANKAFSCAVIPAKGLVEKVEIASSRSLP